MPPVKSNLLTPAAIFSAFGGLIIGLLVGLAIPQLLPKKTVEKAPVVINKPNNDSIFSTELATINGKIIKIDETSLTVQNDTKSAVFNLNQPIFISKPSSLSKPSSPSGDIKIVPLNEFATINLQKIDGEYKVTNIFLLPPIGIPQPIPENLPISSPPTR